MSRRRILIAREYRPLVKAALGAGWTLTQTQRGHPKITTPDGSYATPIPATSSGRSRLLKAVTLRLRKHGVEV